MQVVPIERHERTIGTVAERDVQVSGRYLRGP